MRFEPFLVSIEHQGTTYSDYGKNRENPQNCAKRILYENCGVKKEYVIAVDGSKFVPVSSVPDEVKTEWPNGALSIPHFFFKAE